MEILTHRSNLPTLWKLTMSDIFKCERESPFQFNKSNGLDGYIKRNIQERSATIQELSNIDTESKHADVQVSNQSYKAPLE